MWDAISITLKITKMIIYGWIKPETAIQINDHIYIHQTTNKKWPVKQASIINNVYKRVQLLSDVHYILPLTTEMNLQVTHHPRYKDKNTKHITV